MNKITILSFILFLINFNAYAGGGRTVGNGGDVLKCLSSNKDTYQILDWYEGENIRNLNLDIGSDNLNVDQKLQIALTRLSRLSPARALRYQAHIKTFMSEIKWMPEGSLQDVKDSDEVAFPSNCKILQIANQSIPILSTDKRYLIDEYLWSKLDSNQKAALLLHEVILREAVEIGHLNSVSARYLNSLILSTEIEQLPIEEFTEILKKLDFTSNSIQGINIDLKEYEFYSNGNLKSAKVIPGAIFNFRDNKIPLTGNIIFYENGEVQEFTPFNTTRIKFQNQIYNVLPFAVSIYQNGNLQNLKLSDATEFSFSGHTFKFQGDIKFYENGILKIAVANSGFVNIPGFENSQLPIKDVVKFYENGNLQEVTIKTDYSLPNFKNNAKWSARLILDQNEKVANAFLVEVININIQGKKVNLMPFNFVEFWSDTGKIKSARVKDATIFTTIKNKSVKVPADSNVSFDQNELLITDK